MTPAERTRKSLGLALRALQEPGKASACAVAMGASDSTVSRLKNERLEECISLLSHLGLKVVPADHKCMSLKAFEFLTSTHEKIVREAPHLVWEIEQ